MAVFTWGTGTAARASLVAPRDRGARAHAAHHDPGKRRVLPTQRDPRESLRVQRITSPRGAGWVVVGFVLLGACGCGR